MDTIKEKEAFENIDIADDFWEINHSFIDSFTDDFGDDIIKDNNKY